MTINNCTIKSNGTPKSGDSAEPGFNGGGGVFNGGDMTLLSTVVDSNTTYSLVGRVTPAITMPKKPLTLGF